jgi:glycerol-3-phosphate cytidylyltransferase
MTIAYVQGTFDLYHTGHINLLKRAKKIADTVVVALLTDEAITKYRGQPPVISYKDRYNALISCVYVDVIIPSNPEKTKDEILLVKPDFVVLGSDWAKKNIYKQYRCDREFLDQYLVYFPYTPHISSTSIKKRISERSN